MPKPAPIYLTPKELAARWWLGRSTVYEFLARGELAYYHLGKTIRIALADIEAYEAAGYEQAVVLPKVLRQKRGRAS